MDAAHIAPPPGPEIGTPQARGSQAQSPFAVETAAWGRYISAGSRPLIATQYVSISFLRAIDLAALLFIGLVGPAYAYVDPGSGSLLLQILIAFAVGFMFYLRKFRQKVAEFLNLGGRKTKNRDVEPGEGG